MKYNFNKEQKRMTKKDDSFLCSKYKMTLKDIIKFELKSLIGRFFLKFRNFDDFSKQYLNVGCGFHKPDNFLNLDFFNKSIIFKKKMDPEVQHDLRYPLPFSSNRFNGIFSEHALEHLYPDEAFNLINEIYRCLKIGGTLRLSLPNTEKIITEYYENNLADPDLRTRGESVNRLYAWGHKAHYDAEFVIYLLEAIGFEDVKETNFFQGKDANLFAEQSLRKSNSFYVEGTKVEKKI
tara:strand:+ start:1311 stop:2018 length:708 start_codon:yes stop_codon:yes gene_type:complete